MVSVRNLGFILTLTRASVRILSREMTGLTLEFGAGWGSGEGTWILICYRDRARRTCSWMSYGLGGAKDGPPG